MEENGRTLQLLVKMSEHIIKVNEEEEEPPEMVILQGQIDTSSMLQETMIPKPKPQSTETHKQVECKVCLRKMRSDNLKRHMLKHRELYSLDEDDIRHEIKRRKGLHETREEREQLVRQIAEQEGFPPEYCDIEVPDALRPISIEKELMDDDRVYTRKIEHGRIIASVLEKGSAREDSLSKDNRSVLKLYRKQFSMRNLLLPSTELRLWQQQLMDNISSPSDREIIWVIGQKGNEGKTFFQEYVETFYGYARVVRLDLKMKSANVLHVLTKRPLSTTDIFLFNVPRAVTHESCNYAILESIKDGTAVSSKYNNDVIRFKMPNVVVVFSNHIPNTKELSKDRWKVFRIVKAGLSDITVRIWKSQHGAAQSLKESDVETIDDDDFSKS